MEPFVVQISFQWYFLREVRDDWFVPERTYFRSGGLTLVLGEVETLFEIWTVVVQDGSVGFVPNVRADRIGNRSI
jgi:hypothetical protein